MPATEVPGNTPFALNYQWIRVSPVPQDERGNSVSETVTKTQPGVCTSWQCNFLSHALLLGIWRVCTQPSCSRHTAKALSGLSLPPPARICWALGELRLDILCSWQQETRQTLTTSQGSKCLQPTWQVKLYRHHGSTKDPRLTTAHQDGPAVGTE